MAIYEYYCPTCRDRFEERRPMSDAKATVSCRRGHAAERVISAFAFAKAGAATLEAPEAPAGGCCGGGACACAN